MKNQQALVIMVRLFDIQNGKVTASEHCYTLKFLKDIMDEYPDEHLRIYAYLFYMTCPNPDLNPFFDVPERDKEESFFKRWMQIFLQMMN